MDLQDADKRIEQLPVVFIKFTDLHGSEDLLVIVQDELFEHRLAAVVNLSRSIEACCGLKRQ